ncbi:aromatic ring-hydroxylating oxygenase subunit alpha [Phenylobacterium soli]|uniref:Rieske (2Fe-2S) protein n=1 Tax=Phenylobacterium soli TaxID=2170551 RepID=A0A328AIP8_9CAUL|nr:SRPBCC family protein [Phenylobacterium soli]RAK54702.1 Rieske (2Fe-2S) protein [Phenylobacterium soli]
MLAIEHYLGDAAMLVDRTNILRRTWQFLGHESQMPQAGNYLADVIGGAPVVVVRQEGRALAGFHNVCRHRAGALVADGSGHCEGAFTCRYHGWKYAFDGRLRNAVDFGKAPGFDPRDYGLFPIRVETWRGLVFVNLDLGAAPLADLVAPLDKHALPDFPLVERRTHHIRCNWKTYVENYLEGYHLPMVHPEFDQDIVVADYRIDIEGEVIFHSAPARDGSVNAGFWAWLWPNLAINTYRHGFMVERMTAVGHDETRLDYFYFFDPARSQELADMFVVSDRVTGQDKQICEEVHRNLCAGIYTGGVLSPKHEQSIAWFQDRVAQSVGAARPAKLLAEAS